MPIDYGSNNVSTSGNFVASSGNFTTASVDNLRLDGNTLSSTSGNIIINPSGTGALQRDAGGNARGQYAVDWQTIRSTSTMVAGGNYSVVGGGRSNTASNSYSTVGGGAFNTASNSYSTVGGGRFNNSSNTSSTVGGGNANTSSGGYSTIGGGRQNTSSGAYSTVGGGRSNTASNSYSTVGGGIGNTSSNAGSTVGGGNANTSSGSYSTIPGGFAAKATRYGELSHAAGRFSDDGDSQHSIFVLRGKTTIGSQTTTLGLNGTTISRLTIESGTILSGTINIIGSISTGSSVARYLRQFSIKNVGGTTGLVGSIITLGTDEDAGTTIAITADDTSDALQIQVTRAANETWRWVAVVDAISIKYGI